jgi:hypothetical protein
LENSAENFEMLFAIHKEIGFEGNLARLVEATNNISPVGQKFNINNSLLPYLIQAPNRAFNFINSHDFTALKQELTVPRQHPQLPR